MRSALAIVALVTASSTVSAQEFRFTQIDVPNARFTRPFGVNASGQIVGVFQDSSGASHGFLRNPDDAYTILDVPGAIFTNASGINARGDIVGRWTDAAHVNHALAHTWLTANRSAGWATCPLTQNACVRVLVDRGADLYSADSSGSTALEAVLASRSILHRVPSIELFALSAPGPASASSLKPISRIG